MTTRNLRAYYYSFEPTGCDPVDAILEAVACTGKAYHHTEDWSDPDRDGLTPVDKIQKAAHDAARAFGEDTQQEKA